MQISKGPSGRDSDAGFWPVWGTPCWPECPSEAHINPGLWQPDMCPHFLLLHEQMTTVFPSMSDQRYIWGLGNWCSIAKLGLGTEAPFFFFCRRAQTVLYQNLRATSSSTQLCPTGRKMCLQVKSVILSPGIAIFWQLGHIKCS